MRNNRSEILALLRRALMAQKELGFDELLLSPQATENLGAIAMYSDVLGTADATGVGNSLSGGTSQKVAGEYKEAVFTNVKEHYDAICECQNCPLGRTRNKFVYGVGNPNADVMFIGEAPGAEEDRRGEPFVGRAGQLLDKILIAIGFSRDQVYIANILKCRPPGNRDPLPEEMDQCFGYLREQIRIIQPKLLCALGRVAAQALLKTKTPLGKLRGTWHEFEGVPLLVTYHPAALLRFPAYKKDTWEDVQKLKAEYDSVT